MIDVDADEVQRAAEARVLAAERADAACAEIDERLRKLRARMDHLRAERGSGYVEGLYMGERAERERARRLEALADMLATAEKMWERAA